MQQGKRPRAGSSRWPPDRRDPNDEIRVVVIVREQKHVSVRVHSTHNTCVGQIESRASFDDRGPAARDIRVGIAAQDDFLGSTDGQSWKYCLRQYSSITDTIMLAKMTSARQRREVTSEAQYRLGKDVLRRNRWPV